MHHDASNDAPQAYKFGIKEAAVFLRTGKKTKLLQYKGKKFKFDNEVKTHDNGTFEFVSIDDDRKQPAKVKEANTSDGKKAADEKKLLVTIWLKIMKRIYQSVFLRQSKKVRTKPTMNQLV